MNRVLYIVILLCFIATCTYAADGAWGKKKKKKVKKKDPEESTEEVTTEE